MSAEADPLEYRQLDSGLSYRDIRSSDGAIVCAGDRVTVHYDLYLAGDRNVPDELVERTWDVEAPVSFVVGRAEVLLGIDEGVVGMAVASERLLRIPPDLAFGARGCAGRVPANAELVVKLYVVTKA